MLVTIIGLSHTLQLPWPSGKSVRLGSGRLGFDSESGKTKDFKTGIASSPACGLTLTIKGTVWRTSQKLTCCAVGKSTLRDSPFLV